jgi:hypothetical protein
MKEVQSHLFENFFNLKEKYNNEKVDILSKLKEVKSPLIL